MSHRARKGSGVAAGKAVRESVDVVVESRRGFLMLGGAAMVAGLVEACSSATKGRAGMGGGQASGGAGTGGMGTGAAAGGTTGAGGAPGSGGALGSGGGLGSGGAAGTGGAGNGGADGRGGTSGKDAAAGAGGTAGTSATEKGGTSGAGGAPGSGGAGAGGSPGVDGGGTGKWPTENTGAGCTVGSVPATNNAKLPDPFKLFSGKRISTKQEWTCLRAELSAALQAAVYGPKMPKPDTLTASYSGGQLTINMTVGTNKQTLTVPVTGGGTASKPTPCVIACGGSSLPLSGIAKITMAPNTISSESDLSGIVKSLYGNACAKSGALIGWAWGCSRIIDALELCPDAGIDVHRLTVTGCSRYGKGALAMGAFDERVALTLPQESGSGGVALWRVATAEKKAGANIQECAEITGEAKWQGSDFKGFCGSGGNGIASLPCDQHFAVALCAPRAILMIENDIDWLGAVPVYGGGIAGQMVFDALGIKDRCGISVSANHGHCSFPSAQQTYLDAYVNRFLKGTGTTTAIDDFHVSSTSKLGKFDKAQWIDWDIPTLSGSLPYDPFA